VSEFSDDELARYSRHFVLPGVGPEGQRKLRDASVLLIGAGGLGSPVALYLAAAGIGRIGLIDGDVVDLSNLQRQVLHDTASVGSSKVASAIARLRDLNPTVQVDALTGRFDASNARALVSTYDIVVDGSDNFPTRYLVNDACVLEKKPNVHGAVFRFEGQLTIFDAARGGPCYRCLFPSPPPAGSVPSCEEGGVLGVLPGIIGTMQANEALKLLLGIGTPMVGRLLLFDALSLRFREIAVNRNVDCPLCGDHPVIHDVTELNQTCSTEGIGTMSNEITPAELAGELEKGASYRIVDVREPHEWALSHIESATHIPLGAIPQRAGELDPDTPTVVYCRSGGRSARAAQFLREKGFKNVMNLAGGLSRWAREVDPKIKV
jgi:adenylyltransferase/sulfurtransferase